MRFDALTAWIIPCLALALAIVFAQSIAGAPASDSVFILPLVIACSIFAVIVILREIICRIKAPALFRGEPDGFSWRLAALCVLVVLFLIAIGLIGFFESALVFLVATMTILGERSLLRLVLVPLVLLCLFYYLFVVVLGAPFPPSILGLD